MFFDQYLKHTEFKSQHSVNKQRQFNFDFNVPLSENLYIALELVKQRMQ